MTTEDFKARVEVMSPLISDCVLAGMVKSFEKEIASKRRCSLIQSFEQLVMILVRRDVVDPEDEMTWANLNRVCIKFGVEPFYTPIHRGVQSLQPPPPPHHNVAQASDLMDPLDPEGDIVRYLSKRIKQSWRNFARGLYVQQGNIDDIEEKCGDDYEACVRAVLDHYKKNIRWASSSGDPIEDIKCSLTLLQKDYLLKEFGQLMRKM